MTKFFVLFALCAITESGFGQVITNVSATQSVTVSDSATGSTSHNNSNSSTGLNTSTSTSLGAWTAQNGNVTVTSTGESSSSSNSLPYGTNTATYSYSLLGGTNLQNPIASPQGEYSSQSDSQTSNSFSFTLAAATTVALSFTFRDYSPGDLIFDGYSNRFSFGILSTSSNFIYDNFWVDGYNGATTNSTYTNSFILPAGNYVLSSTSTSETAFQWIAGYGPTEEMTGTSTANDSYSMTFNPSPAPEPCSMLLAAGAVSIFVKRRFKKDNL